LYITETKHYWLNQNQNSVSTELIEMTTSNLQQTTFSVEKIRNIVNVGRSSAYQIYTTPGEQIGFLGKLNIAELNRSANDMSFIQEISENTKGRAPVSWLKRTLTALAI